MPRTIILTLANPTPNAPYSRSEYWSLTEDGRIINGMCWDEMLGAVARVTQGTEQRFPWLTVEEYEERAKERESRKEPPERALLRGIVAQISDPANAEHTLSAFMTGAQISEARDLIAKADEADDIPF